MKKIMIATAVLCAIAAHAAAQQSARGIVYHDENRNRSFDQGEKPLPGIRVSNGREIVKTNEEGRYELPIGETGEIFVIKPSGWTTPFNDEMLPQFHYIHRPVGSAKTRFAGVAPTGPLPESINFALYPQDEPETFKMIVFADPQPRNIQEVDYVAHDVIPELIGTDASLGVTLGDIAFDNLDTFEPLNRAIALIGIPWYNVIGNHDVNKDARHNDLANETFNRVYGPAYYSFDYGNTHFIAIDSVIWEFPEGEEKGKYHGGLDQRQIAFIENDLALIPEDQMVVLMMHVPLPELRNARRLYRMIEKRPMSVSISGHTHFQQHRFLNEKDGWQGAKPHHHIVNVTVSGSWWRGALDEQGIPQTPMRDGAPNGYAIMTFDKTGYQWEFKAARRPASYQMSIYAPDAVRREDLAQTEFFANIFGGSRRTTVEFRIGEGEWQPMEKVDRPDPFYLDMKKLEESETPPSGTRLPAAIDSSHLWRAVLPTGLGIGTHAIEVRTKDMWGKQHRDMRAVRVRR